MAAGDKFFGYKSDPFIGSRVANFTDDTRGGSSGSSSSSAHVKLSDTYNMPDGIYKITLNFQVYHNTADHFIYIDTGTTVHRLQHVWKNGILIGQISTLEYILPVDKGAGQEWVTIVYPSGFYGLNVTFQYLGAL